MCLSIPAFLAIAASCATIQYWRTKSWAQAVGRVDSARLVSREVQSRSFRTFGNGSDTQFITTGGLKTQNLEEIAYSFSVDLHAYHSNRVDLATKPDLSQTAANLKRYPQGKVVTVYYNPSDPSECVLERVDLRELLSAWRAIAVLVAWILAAFVAFTHGADWVQGVIAKPERTPAVMWMVGFALAMTLFGAAAGKQARMMKKWPTTPGVIIRSEVIVATQRATGPYLRRYQDVTMYQPRIVYSYTVDGNTFQGDDIGWSSSASRPSVAEKYVRRFPPQSPVQVFYNPDDPTQATLAVAGSTLSAVLWSLAAALVLAAIATGWFVP